MTVTTDHVDAAVSCLSSFTVTSSLLHSGKSVSALHLKVGCAGGENMEKSSSEM